MINKSFLDSTKPPPQLFWKLCPTYIIFVTKILSWASETVILFLLLHYHFYYLCIWSALPVAYWQNKNPKGSWHIYRLGTHFRFKGSLRKVVWFFRCWCFFFCLSDTCLRTLEALFLFHPRISHCLAESCRTKASTGWDGLNTIPHPRARTK